MTKTEKKTSKTARKTTTAATRRAAKAPSTRAGTKATKPVLKATKAGVKAAAKTAKKAPAKAPTAAALKGATRGAAKAAAQPAPKTASAPAGAVAAVGRPVPAWNANATGGRTVTSASLAGRPYVLYFYPKDDTPGCTAEGRDFAARYDDFRSLGVEVLGVSRDSLESHERFKAKLGLPFDLIADPDETLCRLFDVIREKSLYGRKFMGVERSTFLVDASGVLVREWRKVKVNGHVENVLQAARSL